MRENSKKIPSKYSLLFPTSGVWLWIILSLLSIRLKLIKVLTSWKSGQLLSRNSPTYLGLTHQKMTMKMLSLQSPFQMTTRLSTTLFNLPSFKIGSTGMTGLSGRWSRIPSLTTSMTSWDSVTRMSQHLKAWRGQWWGLIMTSGSVNKKKGINFKQQELYKAIHQKHLDLPKEDLLLLQKALHWLTSYPETKPRDYYYRYLSCLVLNSYCPAPAASWA